VKSTTTTSPTSSVAGGPGTGRSEAGGSDYEDLEGYVWVCECPAEDWSWPVFLYGCLAAGGGVVLLGLLLKVVCFRRKTYRSEFSMPMNEF